MRASDAAAGAGTEYKRSAMRVWNEVAPRYHARWAGAGRGPFSCTDELVRMAGIRYGDRVLDMACGTGAVTAKISRTVGPDGHVTGVDVSASAVRIARAAVRGNADFVLADAEAVPARGGFDAVTCQFALFFFPDAQGALRGARGMLKRRGTLAVSVHGRRVPFFSCILDAVTEMIPDYLTHGPGPDRFDTQKSLRAEVGSAGFTGIESRCMTVTYSPGGFDDYWDGYRRYVARPQRKKLGGLSRRQAAELAELVKTNTEPYATTGGDLVFPWEILILTARS